MSPRDTDKSVCPEIGPDIVWQEYCAIQEKIDRVGEFGFQVKAWTAALVTASLFGGLSSDRPQWWYPLLAIPLLLCFWALDSQQQRIQKALGRRAHSLEVIINRRSPDNFKSPGIVRALVNSTPSSDGYSPENLPRQVAKNFYVILFWVTVMASIAIKCSETPNQLPLHSNDYGASEQSR